MTFALLTAAGILLLAAWLAHRGVARHPNSRVPAVDPRAHDYEGLGSAGQAAAGDPTVSGLFCGDAHAADGVAFLGVMVDGIGDAAESERTRALVLQAFLVRFDETSDDDPARSIPSRLSSALDAAHEALRALPETDGSAPASGASLAAAVIDTEGLHWVSIGSTRICLQRDDVLHQVTSEQTFGALLARSVMRGQLSPADAAAKQERGALTSYVGGPDPAEVDASRRALPLLPGDRVILSTAGLHERLALDAMEAVVRSSPSACSPALVDAAGRAAPLAGQGGHAGQQPPAAIAAIDFSFSPRGGVAPATPPQRAPGSHTTVRVEPEVEAGVRVGAG